MNFQLLSKVSENEIPKKIPRLVWLLSALLFFYGFFLGGQQMMLVKIGQWFGVNIAVHGTLVGVSYGPIWSTLVAGAAEHFPEHRAAAVGAMSSGCGVGGIICPVLVGLIAEHLSARIAFFVLSGSACIGALISLRIKNLTPQRQKSAK